MFIVSPGLGSPGVLTYDPDGAFSGLWGSGQGPGEFQGAARILTASGDVLVQDLTTLIHVLSPDRELRRYIRGVPIASTSPVALSDTVLAVPRRVEAGERPVQLFDLRSGERIGAAGPLRGPDQEQVPVHVASSRGGGLWVGTRPGRFEHWTLESDEPSIRLRLEDAWLRSLDPARRPTMDLADAVRDVHLWEDPDTGWLWVLAVVLAPGETGMPEVEPGAPLPADFFSPRRMERTMNTVLSVVDPLERVVLANVVLNLVAWQFVEDGQVVAFREDEDGFQWAEVLTFTLHGR
ncbi:MAG: hypothetical protein EA422_11015 [Gemmatimonadales bacterium]|nr:MAG: hypothetical protein EA422_11015 [Gemmatimonadales bacterium]